MIVLLRPRFAERRGIGWWSTRYITGLYYDLFEVYQYKESQRGRGGWERGEGEGGMEGEGKRNPSPNLTSERPFLKGLMSVSQERCWTCFKSQGGGQMWFNSQAKHGLKVEGEAECDFNSLERVNLSKPILVPFNWLNWASAWLVAVQYVPN